MSDNVFKVLGIQSHEDSVSNALAYAINESEDFRNGFLKHICQKELDAYKKCSAYTRISTGESGIPDLVLVCESQGKAELIVIENKLKAEEGIDQTERYSTEESIIALGQRLCPNYNRGSVIASFVFLTLFPDQEPSSKKFIVKRHRDLCAIYQNKKGISNLADQLIFDWLDLVTAFYSKENTDLEDNVCQKLQDDDGLDGGYLYFRTFLTQLNLPEGLQREDFFRASQQGRRYYGAIFSKDSWHPAEMTESDGTWMLDADQVFNIHFEPQFNVLSGIFSIFLHYEVNPYEPANWVKIHIPASQYAAYMDRRNEFTHLLQNKKPKDWVFGGASNQIAKVKLNFIDYSLREVKSNIENIFSKTSAAIDEVLSKL
jgi:hypothetical protein